MKRNLLTNLEKPGPADAKVGARVKWCVFVILITFCFNKSWSQVASSTWALTTNASYVVVGNVTSANATGGSGIGTISFSATNGMYANGWNSASRDLNDYFQYTISPAAGCSFTVSATSFYHNVSGGTMNAAVYYSLDNFATSTQLGSNISVSTTSTQFSNSTAIVVNPGSTLRFRVYGWGADASTRTFRNKTFIVSGTTSCSTPTITVNPTTLTGFTYVQGSGPSTSQSYNLSGTNLTGFPGNITITGSTNYEVSTDNSTFSGSVTVPYASATLAATPIYVRLKAGLTVNTYNGETISNNGGGVASAVNVTCSGTVTAVGGGGGCATDLIISEYIEGSSNNKAIEIYNGTGVSVDLSNYSVNMYTNGSAAPTNTLSMVGSLADGAVFVIANSSASAAILALADTTAGVALFNGDDAVALLKSGSVIDVIGQIGFDPGTEWGSGTTSTADNTIRRQAIITNGDSNGSDVFDPSLEWDGFSIDDISGLGSHSMTCSSNTITTGTVSTPPFAVTCSTGATGTVAFTSTDLFSSNTYTAQLSNASGSFASPVNIGTLVSDANSGTISFTIPPGTPTGSGYMIRVISSNPVVIGSNSATFNVTLSGGPCSCYEIESILVDACDEGVEGENEMFRFTVGGGDLNTSDIFIDWPNNPWLGVCQNAATDSIVAGINATVTLPGQVVQPVGGVIPAGATVMFFTSTAFDFSKFDFSALNYTLYAVFQCEGNTQGHFGNHTSTGDKTLVLECGSGCHSETVTYNADSLYAGDGATVDFDVPGTPTYSDSGYCASVPIFDVLPIDLIFFKSICDGNSAVLYWSTATETNNAYFTIEAADAANADFVPVAKVNGAGNSNEVLNYSVEVESSAKYFRLKQTDYDGKFTYSDVIAVDCEGSPVQLFPTLAAEGENITIIGEVSSIRVFDSMGREVFPEINENKVCCLEPGMYFFVINGKSNHKVVVQ